MAEMEEKRPESVGRYKILAELGRGAMGAVYKAVDPKLDRTVAVKTIISAASEAEDREEMLARFEREARVSAKLQHPNVVAVYDVGVEGDELYLVMEMVDGETLGQRLARGQFPDTKESLEFIAQAADALAAAHEAGIIHRDIKPGNMMITKRGRLKVADFGVAKAAGEKMELTRTGMMVGSPAYMSPEQVKGMPLDGRSDLFSLGVVLYELILRRKPFPADTVTTLVYQILHEDPLKDVPIPDQVSSDLADFIRWTLAKDREMRIPDARTFSERARALAAGQAIPRSEIQGATTMIPAPPEARTAMLDRPPAAVASSAPPPQTTHVQQVAGSKKGLWIGVAAAAVVVLALGGWLLFGRGQKPTESAADAGPQTLEAQVTSRPTLEATQAQAPSAPSELEISIPEPSQTQPPETTGDGISSPQTEAPAAPVARPKKVVQAPAKQQAPVQESASSSAASQSSESAERPAVAFQVPAASTVKETYSARRAVQFTIRPTSAVITINGVDIGTAGDWDSFLGGGKPYAIPTPGDYYVHVTADGYEPMWIKIQIREDAADLTARIRTKMDRAKGKKD
jgi:serine/threonine protein kinase